MPRKSLSDVIVLLPGILGSVLQKDGKDIWAISGQAVWQTVTSLANNPLHHLILKEDDLGVDVLRDGIRAVGLMPDAHLIPGFFKIDGYAKTAHSIIQTFEIIRGNAQDEKPANFLEFPYDWRRDNRVAARQLKEVVDRKLWSWRQHTGKIDAKVIFLAHSMGGLVARYYLEELEGWPDCRALITFGCPYRGSLNALNFLVNGYKKLSFDVTEVIRSFTSVYQLLPIYQVVKSEGSYKRVAEIAGIPGMLQARAQQALDFHRAIENAVTRHQQDNEYLRHGYTILPIVGTRQPTTQSAEFVNGRLMMSRQLPEGIDEWFSDGDGTVPRVSAIPIELSEKYQDTFIPERHSSLQRNDDVLNKLLKRLEQMQAVKGSEKIRGPEISSEAEERPAISLELDDVYFSNETVDINAELINLSRSAGTLIAKIVSIGGNRAMVIEKEFHEEDGKWRLRMEDIPCGLYRLEVLTTTAGPWAPSPVHDLFEVVE